MPQQEGVIKFQLAFTEEPPMASGETAELNAWRKILYRLGLIGRDPARYGGFGYGNVSRRLPPLDAPAARRGFIISGTQTGGLAELAPEHYTRVSECRLENNAIQAEGPIHPSSEALTHGAVYARDASLQWVMHVHSPEIWQRAQALGLAVTSPQAAYGTQEMTAEVQRLFAERDVAKAGIFAMGGHEDGIVAFGVTAQQAGTVLTGVLARALALEQGALAPSGRNETLSGASTG